MDRIDVHHHFVPQLYVDAHNAISKTSPSGFKLPEWSLQSSLEFMKTHRIRTAILSLIGPGTNIFEGKAAAQLCRDANNYAANLCKDHPTEFGFFGSVPPLHGSHDAVLDEVAYCLDVLKADGIILFTRYGKDNHHYLGHPDLRALWDELDRRHAVVFVHPTDPADAAQLVNPAMPPPVIDYPHETTRAAVDLIVSDTVKTHPNVKIILSHAGGTLPYVALRAARVTADFGLIRKSAEEFLEEARSFYYDVALSADHLTLDHLFGFAKPGHVLYGSDFPPAPRKTIDAFNSMLDEYRPDDAEMRYSATRGAAVELFPRFKTSTG